MNEEMLKRIDALAAKLEMSASTLYAALLREIVLAALAQTILGTAVFLSCLFLCRRFARLARKDDYDDLPLYILPIIFSAILVIVGFCYATDGLDDLIAPHKALMGLLR